MAPSAEALAKERAELQMVFRLFDRDRNGHLTAEELAEVFRRYTQRPCPIYNNRRIASF